MAKNVPLLLYVPPAVKARIEEMAREQDSSVARVGRLVLRAGLVHMGRDVPPPGKEPR